MSARAREIPEMLEVARGRFAGQRLHVTAIGVVYVTGRLTGPDGAILRVMIPRANFNDDLGPGDDERSAAKRIRAREPDLLAVVLR